MKLPLTSITFLRWCCAALAACSFTACGGGGGDNGGGTTQLLASPGVVTSTNGALLANTFGTVLSGTNETPANPSPASGVGAVIVDPATKVMKGVIIAAGLNATAAHIHEGPAGTAGPIIFPFTEVTAGSGIFTATVTLTDAQLATFKAGNYYMNVHSPSFPSGEIRGQLAALQESGTTTLTPSNGTTATGTTVTAAPFNTFLDVMTAQQVTPAASSQGAGIVLGITDTQGKSLTAAVLTQGVAGTTADIHTGAAGSSGAAIFALAPTASGSGIWTTTRGSAQANQAQAQGQGSPNAGPLQALSDAQLASFVSGGYYADVHTAANPNGEIRAQLLLANNGGALTPAAAALAAGAAADSGTAGAGIAATTAATTTTTTTPPNVSMPPMVTVPPAVTTPTAPAGAVSTGAGMPGY